MEYKSALELKGTNIKIHELVIYSNNAEVVSVELKKLKKKAKNIVTKNPIVINFSMISVIDYMFVKEIYESAINIDFKVVGVKNIREKIRNQIIENTEIPIFLNSEEKVNVQKTNEKASELIKDEDTLSNKHLGGVKVFSDVIRTGQKIMHKGDIFILSKINSSAEVYASGSIFVSNFVGGKIFAGIDLDGNGEGNSSAIIYIECFSANLVCINGVYRQFEKIDEKYLNKRVKIYLEEDIIKIKLMEII